MVTAISNRTSGFSGHPAPHGREHLYGYNDGGEAGRELSVKRSLGYLVRMASQFQERA